MIKTPLEILKQVAPGNPMIGGIKSQYDIDEVIDAIEKYHAQFDPSGLNYEKLGSQLDDFLKSVSKEEMEQWLEMDRKRMEDNDIQRF